MQNAALADFREAMAREDSHRRIREILARAGVRRLSIDEMIEAIAKSSGGNVSPDLLDRLQNARLTASQRSRLRCSLEIVVQQYVRLRSKAGQSRGSVLRRLLPQVGGRAALRLIQPLLHDSLKSRRDTAYSIFRWARIDRPTAVHLLEEYRATGDERVLKVLVSAVGSAQTVDLLPLLTEFDDRYWHMRVFQALLSENMTVPERIIVRYPTEFLQAMARAKHAASLPVARRLLLRRDLRRDLSFIAWFAWAMLEMGAEDDLKSVQVLYERLHARQSGRQRDADSAVSKQPGDGVRSSPRPRPDSAMSGH